MANLARGKTVEEPINKAESVTDGNASEYTGTKGFAHFSWPGTLTVDLGDICKIFWIRLLLWDRLGQGGNLRDQRVYKYRLLSSVDHNCWSVHYNTGDDGYNGWQTFEFKPPFDMRYVRINGLWNSANVGFHVVQLEAHDTVPPPLVGGAILHRTISQHSGETEIGEGLPMTYKMRDLIRKIDDLVEVSDFLNPEPFKKLTSELKIRVGDIAAIESSMGSIRRTIVEPVQKELQKSMKLGKFSVWGFWVGIVGGILAIVSLAINFFK